MKKTQNLFPCLCFGTKEQILLENTHFHERGEFLNKSLLASDEPTRLPIPVRNEGLGVELTVIRVSNLSLRIAVASFMKINVLLDRRHHVVYIIRYKSQMKMTNRVSKLTVIYIT